jgi:hypothetical protein
LASVALMESVKSAYAGKLLAVIALNSNIIADVLRVFIMSVWVVILVSHCT